MGMDTIFALASGRPPAGVAVIRVSGPHAHAAGKVLAGTLPAARRAAIRTLRGGDGQILDDALVLRFDRPGSFTGEDVVELQCHGGRAVVDAVLAALSRMEGLRPAAPGEFTRRAFENGRIDLTEAEGLADLIEAETESQRRAALAMAEGGLSRQIASWQQRVLTLSARAEAAIDYAEDDDIGSDPSLGAEAAALAQELREWLQRPRAEPLKDGVRIVVAGPPNAGKSSLVNALGGMDKAIVTDIPGTTRDSIEIPLAIEGLPIRLIDTAGLRDSTDPVERIGVGRAESALAQADIVLWLGDPGATPTQPRVLKVHSKCDLPGREDAPKGSTAVSATSGRGLSELLAAIASMARLVLPAEDELALNRRQADEVRSACDELLAIESEQDLELVAERLRACRSAFDRLTGRAGMEDVLDSLFGRFCLGK